jgi:hypothetical protein
MTIPKAKIFTCLYLCMTCSIPLWGQVCSTQSNAKSCQQFVETFYKWYLTISLKNDPVPASDRAVKDRPYLFSSELVWRLREQSEVQDRAGSNLVRLDIDPFSGPDGRGDRFTVEKVTTSDDRCRAEIHAVRDEETDESPDVTSELALKHGQWIFVNFYYLSSDPRQAWNLLGALKEARKSWKAEGLLTANKH